MLSPNWCWDERFLAGSPTALELFPREGCTFFDAGKRVDVQIIIPIPFVKGRRLRAAGSTGRGFVTMREIVG
jgi:hypothetical protein